METKYPTLRRPKRKLSFLKSRESPCKQWAGTLALEDIDNMFDDLDPSSHENDLLPPSPLLQTFDTEAIESEREAPQLSGEGHQELPGSQMDPEEDVPQPALRLPSPKLDIDLDFPFKVHEPVQTSSPIEENMVREEAEQMDDEKGGVVSPILFACEDEEAKTESPPTEKPQCNGHGQELNDDSELESPPSKIALSKPMSAHKNKVEGLCKESHLVEAKEPKKSQIPVLEGKRNAPRQENTDPPVSAVRQEQEVPAPKKISESHRQPVEVTTRMGKDMTFLQKLKDAGQPKPACSRKSLSPVKVPTAFEPEEDFLIVEDDTPFLFSIPSKTATTKRRSGTSSTDKDSSTDKEVKDSPLRNAQKQQESEEAKDKLESQTVTQTIKMKGKERKNEDTEPGNNMDDFGSFEDLPACVLMEKQEKPNKKKRLKKVPSNESDQAEEQLIDTASREVAEEHLTLRMKKKTRKSFNMKRSKGLKDGNENAKISKAKSLKGTRKVTQESAAVTETVNVEAVKERSQEPSIKGHADTEDCTSVSDKEIMNSQAQSDKNDKQIKLPVESEDSSILGKRRRRQTGQWWLSCPQSTEETDVTDNHTTVKKAKKSNKGPRAAVLSPVKTKKDRVLKRRNQIPSSKNTNQAKEKKNKWNKNRNTRGGTPEKVKKSEEEHKNTTESEQTEEQEQHPEVLDQDLDPVHSSPLVFAHRDHSLNSGAQLFQRVYQQNSHGKTTPAPRGFKEQLRAADPEKRRRKPPSNWWMVDGKPTDVESISSEPQRQESKVRKERKKQSNLSRSPGPKTPKNGNTAVSSKPQGGADVPLKVMPLSAPKTVKRSLATFKDIFTSPTEVQTMVSSREAGQSNRCKVSTSPAVEVTVTDCITLSKADEDNLSMHACETSSPLDQEALQDSKCQSQNTVKALRSGPSSMIELDQYEDNDDMILPSSRVHGVLSASDLCAPPLKPLTLQPKDKANLTEWFKSLWSTTVDNGSEITPDQFDWYFYQGRAMGFLEDLNCGSICNGKILLGSYMKKPLWVDHSATTVFNLLTSTLSVTIDSCESLINPGQSFMVPCGHAYSIRNITAQPGALYFTRIFAENSD